MQNYRGGLAFCFAGVGDGFRPPGSATTDIRCDSTVIRHEFALWRSASTPFRHKLGEFKVLVRAGCLGCFCLLIGRSSILCRSGTCSGWPGDLVPGPWGSIPGPGRGLRRGSGGPPNLIQIYIFIAIQTSDTCSLQVRCAEQRTKIVRWSCASSAPSS